MGRPINCRILITATHPVAVAKSHLTTPGRHDFHSEGITATLEAMLMEQLSHVGTSLIPL